MPDRRLIELTWHRIVDDNPDLSLEELVELTANELGVETTEVVEVAFPAENLMEASR